MSLQPAAASAERLTYSVHSNTLVAGRGSGSWRASTSIWVWDPQTGKTTTAFSDSVSDIVLLVRYGSGESQERVIIPAESSLFALAEERRLGDSETIIGHAPGAIYELSVDGSNRARRVATVESAWYLDLLAVSADASKLAYIGGEGPSLVILDRTGQTLAKTDLRGFLDGCRVSWLAWSGDGQTLRWVLEANGDAHTWTKAGLAHEGNYVTQWDGTAPTRKRSRFGYEVGVAVAGYPPDSTRHDWVAFAPSGKRFAWRRGVSPSPGVMETGEVWVRDNQTHAQTRIVAIAPTGPIPRGLGAENHFVSLLGWLRR